jgi:hypothetical protein
MRGLALERQAERQFAHSLSSHVRYFHTTLQHYVVEPLKC